jgi:hypothetical protein
MAVLLVMARQLGAMHCGNLLVITPELQSQAGGIDVSMTPQQDGAEANLGQDVEDAIEDALAVGRDDVAALGKTKTDRIEGPKEEGVYSNGRVCPGDVTAERARFARNQL